MAWAAQGFCMFWGFAFAYFVMQRVMQYATKPTEDLNLKMVRLMEERNTIALNQGVAIEEIVILLQSVYDRPRPMTGI